MNRRGNVRVGRREGKVWLGQSVIKETEEKIVTGNGRHLKGNEMKEHRRKKHNKIGRGW